MHMGNRRTIGFRPFSCHGRTGVNRRAGLMGLKCLKGRTAAQRAFSLIELLITIAIVGILSTLAMVGYRKIMTTARLSEATSMCAAIAAAQERYRGEFGTYLNVSNTLGHKGNQGPLCPAPVASTKHGWAPAACVGGASWTALAVQNVGSVSYGYSTTAGLAGAVPADTIPVSLGGNVAWPAGATLTRDWYVVTAAADTDGDGQWALVLTSSWTNQTLLDDRD